MKRRFFTLDVFTDRRFAGNPLAVVLQSEGLDAAAMQTVAREFNLSETVFVLPPADAAHRAGYRIFTPKRELPFAGHPTVGTAVLLASLDGGAAHDMVLEAAIGPVPCRVSPGAAAFDLPVLPSEIGPPPPAETMAAALGLAADDIGFGAFAPSCWSAGVGFTFVPLNSLDAVGRARPDLARFAALGDVAPAAVFAFSKETAEPGLDYQARMFAPSFGIIEDPATGSAVAAFAGVLARFAGLNGGHHDFTIAQGFEMGRPSHIRLGLTLAGGALASASVGGTAVIVAEGTIEA